MVGIDLAGATGIVIDGSGRSWSIDSDDLRGHLHCELPDQQMCTFAVVNLGFVVIIARRRGLQIMVRQHRSSQIAIAEALFFAYRHCSKRFILSVFDGSWQDRLIVGYDKLLTELSRTIVPASVFRQPRFSSSYVKPETLDKDSPIGRLYQRWLYQPVASQEDIAEFCENAFSGRFTIAEHKSSIDDLVLNHVGRGYCSYSNSYLDRAKGTLFSDDPDHAYGEWVAKALHQTMLSGTAIIDDVNATIVAPHRPITVASYRRILAPFTSPGGNPFLVTASVLRTAPDIKLVHEPIQIAH